MSDPTTLADFLLARIAQDEEVASPFRNDSGTVRRWRADEIGGKVRDVGPMEFGLPDVISESDTHLTAAHIARFDPARVIADCDAKRRIVIRCSEMLTAAVPMAVHLAQQTLADLGRPYADHPDYRPEWRA